MEKFRFVISLVTLSGCLKAQSSKLTGYEACRGAYTDEEIEAYVDTTNRISLLEKSRPEKTDFDVSTFDPSKLWFVAYASGDGFTGGTRYSDVFANVQYSIRYTDAITGCPLRDRAALRTTIEANELTDLFAAIRNYLPKKCQENSSTRGYCSYRLVFLDKTELTVSCNDPCVEE